MQTGDYLHLCHYYVIFQCREGADEVLELYLNQLVQAIKHQNFFNTPLVKFLLGMVEVYTTSIILLICS